MVIIDFGIGFLIVMALIWIVFATVQDIKHREVANWLNFSLIIFALAFRFFYSLFHLDSFGFFYQGLIGFGIFLVLGNLFYYMRLFAGGDAKLFIALGAVLPFSTVFMTNIRFLFSYIILLLVVGSVYGFIYGSVLAVIHREKFAKRFKKEFMSSKKLYLLFLVFAVFWSVFVLVIGEFLFLIVGIIFFLFPLMYDYARALENAALLNEVPVKKLSEGDWLNVGVKVGKKFIRPNWEGLQKDEIKSLQNSRIKKVWIKQGIPFVPAFLISFAVLILFYLWNFDLLFWFFR